MDRDLAAVTQIASHGSLWLAAPVGAPPELVDTDLGIPYVAGITFLPEGAPSLEGTAPWLAWLRAAGVRRLHLLKVPRADRSLMHAVVADGPTPTAWEFTWAEASGHSRTEPRWALTARPTPWEVPPRPDLEGFRSEFRGHLVANRDLALGDGHPGNRAHVSSWFADALTLLDGEVDSGGPGGRLLPAGWPVAARRLGAAAERARGAFGSMGAWNDSGPMNETADALKSRLREACERAWPVVVNGPSLP